MVIRGHLPRNGLLVRVCQEIVDYGMETGPSVSMPELLKGKFQTQKGAMEELVCIPVSESIVKYKAGIGEGVIDSKPVLSPVAEHNRHFAVSHQADKGNTELPIQRINGFDVVICGHGGKTTKNRGDNS